MKQESKPSKPKKIRPAEPRVDLNESPKRPVGRPPLELPESIPDTPENIARAIVGAKPKKRGEWRFEKEHRENKNDRK